MGGSGCAVRAAAPVPSPLTYPFFRVGLPWPAPSRCVQSMGVLAQGRSARAAAVHGSSFGARNFPVAHRPRPGPRRVTGACCTWGALSRVAASQFGPRCLYQVAVSKASARGGDVFSSGMPVRTLARWRRWRPASTHDPSSRPVLSVKVLPMDFRCPKLPRRRSSLAPSGIAAPEFAGPIVRLWPDRAVRRRAP